RQDQRAQVLRARCAEDASPKTAANQPREVAAMIKVRMGEDHRVNPPGIDREGGPVPFAQFLQPLKKPAIHQDEAAVQVEQMLRAGDGAGGAEERQRRHRMTILEVMASIRRRTIPREDPVLWSVKES